MDLPYFREGSGLGGTLKEDEERATLGDAKRVPWTPVSAGESSSLSMRDGSSP